MEFIINPNETSIIYPHKMGFYIEALALFVKLFPIGHENYEFIKYRHDLFVEMRDNNLMLYTA